MWNKLRADEYVVDDKVMRNSKEKEEFLRKLDYIYFNSPRVGL